MDTNRHEFCSGCSGKRAACDIGKNILRSRSRHGCRKNLLPTNVRESKRMML